VLRVVKPFPSDLCLLSDLKEELEISGSSRDALLSRLITRASSAITEAIDRPLVRQFYRESVKSYGMGRVLVTVTPTAGLPLLWWMFDPSTDFDSNLLPAIDNVFVKSRPAGILEAMVGFRSTARFMTGIEKEWVGGTEVELIRVDYWGGWHPPSSLFTKTTVSFLASDQSLNDSASGFPLSLQSDDTIRVSGSTSNNGLFRVVSATASKIVVDGSTAILNEAAGASVTIDPRDLPGEIEDAALMLSKVLYLSRNRDTSVVRQKTDDLGVWYSGAPGTGTGSGTRFPVQIQGVIDAYRRATTP
jgi:hypothetical protein